MSRKGVRMLGTCYRYLADKPGRASWRLLSLYECLVLNPSLLYVV